MDRDSEQLEKLGYAQQLLRGMGGFANFALSFSIISVLTGAVTLYGHGLKYGGPIEMFLGWPLVTALTLFIAASLGELASALPTAGALYHWSSWLGGRGAGFLTAWLNTIGQFAITAGIDYGLAEFVAAMLGWSDRPHTVAICAAILLTHAVLNHLGVRLVARLNDLSAWVHVAGVGILVGTLALFAPHQPAAFLLRSHLSEGHGFLIGLLLAAWTFTGYDASAHVSEETHDPTRNAPWGIVLSVAVSGVAGYALLLAVTLSIGDLDKAVAAENPFISVLTSALGARLGNGLVLIAMAAMWFCGLSSVTSNSRMLFAFARDGGLPFSKRLATVSPRFRSPWVAVWTSASAALAVAVWANAYSAMVALSTIALYASYGLPILFHLIGRRLPPGPWNLGNYSKIVNILAIAWIAAALVLFVLPPNQLAGYTFAGCLAALGIYWVSYQHDRFKGPPNFIA
ncbi:MAG: amino acid permease [Myxococcales bacterium]|nr:amino acid permease [Myxococcales bacterium]